MVNMFVSVFLTRAWLAWTKPSMYLRPFYARWWKNRLATFKIPFIESFWLKIIYNANSETTLENKIYWKMFSSMKMVNMYNENTWKWALLPFHVLIWPHTFWYEYIVGKMNNSLTIIIKYTYSFPSLFDIFFGFNFLIKLKKEQI